MDQIQVIITISMEFKIRNSSIMGGGGGKPMKAQLVETRFLPPNLGKYNVTSKYANKNITKYTFEKKKKIQ